MKYLTGGYETCPHSRLYRTNPALASIHRNEISEGLSGSPEDQQQVWRTNLYNRWAGQREVGQPEPWLSQILRTPPPNPTLSDDGIVLEPSLVVLFQHLASPAKAPCHADRWPKVGQTEEMYVYQIWVEKSVFSQHKRSNSCCSRAYGPAVRGHRRS